jgi:hypothetical protein
MNYQVCAEFGKTHRKRELLNTTLHSTEAACTSFPMFTSPHSTLGIYRIFPTLPQAQDYIRYLNKYYHVRQDRLPELDKSQLKLFQEVSE